MAQTFETDKLEITITIKEKPTAKDKSIPKTKPTTKSVSKPLSDYTWAEILQICRNGEAEKHFRIGEKKDIKLTDGEILTVAIADFNHDVDRNDRVVPITFTAVNVLEEDCSMNEMAKYLADLYDRRFPDEVKQVITFAKKGESVEPFFLHSEMEIFGKTIYSNDKSGKQYPYYAEKCHRCKFKNSEDWTANWWERSAHSGNATGFCCVYGDGAADNGDANYSRAVAPAFCVG